MGSRGSIIPILLQNKEEKNISLTDQSMTRFNITLNQSINLVLEAIKSSIGGEIFVPKIPSYRLTDIAKSINKNFKIKFTGIREGEKIHEELISQSDIKYSIDVGRYYIILPFNNSLQKKILKKYPSRKKFDYKNSYNSRDNKIFLSQGEIKKLLKSLPI
jgi:FlaA1/EpsC-like NDP-sugar epimerase